MLKSMVNWWWSFLSLFSLVCLLCISCATTTPKGEFRTQDGYWEAKAQLRNLAKKEVRDMNLDVLSVGPDRFRMDVTGPMGINLATVLISRDKIKYILYQQKKFYEGKLSSQAFLPIIKLRFNPRVLIHLFRGTPLEEPGWECRFDLRHVLKDCENKEENIKVVWNERSKSQKQVTLSDRSFELEIIFKSFTPFDSTKVQSGSNPFQFDLPSDFSWHKIP